MAHAVLFLPPTTEVPRSKPAVVVQRRRAFAPVAGRIRVTRQKAEPGCAPERYSVVDAADQPIAEIDCFLTHLRTLGRNEQTIRSYAYDLQLFFQWLAVQRLDVWQLTLEELPGFFSWVVSRPPTPRGAGQVAPPSRLVPRSMTTLNSKRAHLRAFYRFYALRDPSAQTLAVLGGLDRRWGSELPLEERGRRRLTRWDEPQPQPPTLTYEQTVTLLDACETRRDRFFFQLLDLSGLRIGEALGLRHDDIRLRRGLVRVVPRVDAATGARVKGLQAREVPVPDALFDGYADYMDHEYREIDSPFVFVHLRHHRRGEPQTNHSVYGVVRRLRQRTGLHFYTPYVSRHTYATRLLRAGVPLGTVANLMGHANLHQTWKTYAHLDAEDHRCTLLAAGILPASTGIGAPS